MDRNLMRGATVTPPLFVVGSDAIPNDNMLYIKCFQQFGKGNFTVVLHKQVIDRQWRRVRIKSGLLGEEEECFIPDTKEVVLQDKRAFRSCSVQTHHSALGSEAAFVVFHVEIIPVGGGERGRVQKERAVFPLRDAHDRLPVY